jgi:hypothetical protein
MLLALHQRPCSKNDSVEVTCHKAEIEISIDTPKLQTPTLEPLLSYLFVRSSK